MRVAAAQAAASGHAETQLASKTSSSAKKPMSPIVPRVCPASTSFSGMTVDWLYVFAARANRPYTVIVHWQHELVILRP